MNRIKIISILSIVIAAFSSCAKDDYKLDSSVNPFVRFNFLVSSSNIPLEYPAVSTSLVPVSVYENKSVKILKLPVSLTSTKVKSSVTVNFSAATSGDVNSFSVEPKSELLFEANKLTDTIYVSFDERWKDNQTISLKLENTSDPEIHIGNLNSSAPNDTFTINLGEIATTYNFPVKDIIIKGEVGEKVDFKVNFPNGFIPSEIENLSIFKFLNGFDYSLTHDAYSDDRSSITYHLTLLEDLQNDDVRYQTNISLNSTTNYTPTGNTILQISKPVKSTRDILANPASNFYNLSDTYYRTYGANWFDKSGTCSWLTFNAFTYPIVVTKDNENAIQYSGQATADVSDDVYHDAFRIGFNVVTGSSTTNSFGLKAWFSNESTDAVNSPGFNITSALEFFPDNGNSKTKGSVLVIPQFITIAAKNGKSHSIAISGEGTYKEISKGLFEIAFELKLNNDELFGGTVSSQYRIYNQSSFPTLSPLNQPCLKIIDL
jgi:hypothetical protein